MTKTKSSTLVLPPPRLGHGQRVSWRIRALSQPRRYYLDTGEGMPELTASGVRRSAVGAECPDRVQDMALPYLWRLFLLKRMYKHRFDEKRLEKINELIEAGNATMYAKLANAVVDTKKAEVKRRKGWTDSDWKKHMDYIAPLAEPKPNFLPRKQKKSKWRPLPELLPRIGVLSRPTSFKIYKRLSKEEWYRDPVKVRETALKYVISERMKELAKPKEIPTE